MVLTVVGSLPTATSGLFSTKRIGPASVRRRCRHRRVSCRRSGAASLSRPLLARLARPSLIEDALEVLHHLFGVLGLRHCLIRQPPKDGPPAKRKLPTFSIVSFDQGEANHLRFVDESPLVSRRFGGLYSLDLPSAKTNTRKCVP